MNKIRALRADEVECRVAQVSAKGCSLLLYKDSRCDKRILDETFGIFGWKDRYEVIKGNLYCTVSLYDKDTKQWIDKCDCGTESYTEKEKGEASDAFKRACFNVGIGRELYTKIFIFIPCETVKDDKGRYQLKDRFSKWHVTKMTVDNENEKITALEIADKQDKVVFRYHGGKVEPATVQAAETKCAKCGKEIKALKNKEGQVVSPRQIAEQTGDLCMTCFRVHAE